MIVESETIQVDSCDLLNMIKPIEQAITEYAPQRIYTHYPGDVNIDHQRISEAVITAARSTPNHPTQTILFFEVPSSTEWQVSPAKSPFQPNWFVDISDTLSLKQKALAAYASEMRSFPHPRSESAIGHLAHWRGALLRSRSSRSLCFSPPSSRIAYLVDENLNHHDNGSWQAEIELIQP